MSKFENNPSSVTEIGNIFRDDLMSIRDNLVSVNVATGTDALKNTDGFTTNRSASISSTTEWAHQGNRSLKVVTQGISDQEGVRTLALPCSEGDMITAKMVIHGVLNKGRVVMRFRTADHVSILHVYDPNNITVDLDNTTRQIHIPLTEAPPETAYMDIQFITSSDITYKMATTFYVDRIIVSDRELPTYYQWIEGDGRVIDGVFNPAVLYKCYKVPVMSVEQIGNVMSNSFYIKYKP